MSYKNEDFYRGKRPDEKLERDYRGWACAGSDRTLCVGHFLDRKRIALYVRHEADPSHIIYTPVAAQDAARVAAMALVVRDTITTEQFDQLYGPWKSVMEAGPST